MFRKLNNLTVDQVIVLLDTGLMLRKQIKQARPRKLGYYAAVREAFKEYGFPLRLVMCGRVENGRFLLTNKIK